MGDTIDFYNIIFSPEANINYNQYEQVFGAGEAGSYASIRQLVNSGIPAYKLVIAEPGSQGLTTGGASARDLGEWTKKAYDSMGWYAGVALWEFSSDPQGQDISSAAGYITDKFLKSGQSTTN